MNWKPIETAPKDGKPFIAHENGDAYKCWWHRDDTEGDYWQNEADSEPNPDLWIEWPEVQK